MNASCAGQVLRSGHASEVMVTSSFVGGRLALTLLPSDLEEWSLALDLPAAGQDPGCRRESWRMR
ncbi:DUF5959 family protein [Streptomyces sp. NPDC056844]|uniref:DUF5959 family protein n=1 Tax=unclassified Streptomyces TaxID=2593676 RepID=UPI0036A73E54